MVSSEVKTGSPTVEPFLLLSHAGAGGAGKSCWLKKSSKVCRLPNESIGFLGVLSLEAAVGGGGVGRRGGSLFPSNCASSSIGSMFTMIAACVGGVVVRSRLSSSCGREEGALEISPQSALVQIWTHAVLNQPPQLAVYFTSLSKVFRHTSRRALCTRPATGLLSVA